jgi:hypothetical protein
MKATMAEVNSDTIQSIEKIISEFEAVRDELKGMLFSLRCLASHTTSRLACIVTAATTHWDSPTSFVSTFRPYVYL